MTPYFWPTLTVLAAQSLPIPPGSTATVVTGANATAQPIPDVGTAVSTLSIAGADPFAWDVDVATSISHPSTAHLDLEIESPAGTVAILSTGNAFPSASSPAEEIEWDGASAADVTDLSATAPPGPLNPEGALDAFRGEDPNGTWTLRIRDAAPGDAGTLHAWRLEVTALCQDVARPIQSSAARSPGSPIDDLAPLVDSLAVANLGAFTDEVVLVTEIVHGRPGDLDIHLTSPAGTVVAVSTGNGGSSGDLFDGMLWSEHAQNPITEFPDASGPSGTFQPEGSFARFRGEDPNGAWTIEVRDHAPGEDGTLVRWEIRVGTAGHEVGVYCTAGTTTNGCAARISASGTPRASSGEPFDVLVCDVEGDRSGIVFYGVSGAAAAPWAAGSTSYMCVASPVQRTEVQYGSGAAGSCDGLLRLDWNRYVGDHPGALGQPFAAGDEVWAQGWFRDPPAPKTTHLSDGLHFVVAP